MNQQPKPQFLQVTTPQGSTVFVNIHAIRRAEYFPANENGGSMLFLDTPGGQATSLEGEADALWSLLQPLAVDVAEPEHGPIGLGMREGELMGLDAGTGPWVDDGFRHA